MRHDAPHDPVPGATLVEGPALRRPGPERRGHPWASELTVPARLPSPAPKTLLGRYLLLSVLGEGGMGVVYVAYDPELDRKVALKLLHGKAPDPADPTSTDPNAPARLQREAQALARLSHPHVVQVYDVGTFDGQLFLTMELVTGETLAERLGRERPRWREVLALLRAAGQGLAAAHAAGLVHRDFKPTNVLVGEDGRVRVADFGISRLADGEEPGPPGAVPADLDLTAALSNLGASSQVLETPLTQVGVVLGTPRYLAPEVTLRGEVSPQSDQFAFAVALYEALYRQPPFAGSSLLELAASAEAGVVREPPRASGVPGWVRRIVLRALAADPRERYPTMDALLADLAVDRSARRRRRLLVAGLAAAAMVAAAAIFWLGRARGDLCRGAEQRLAGIWDSPRRAAVERAFAATGKPYAAAAWTTVSRGLDGYARSWVAMRTAACQATNVTGEQSQALLDLRMHCLDQRAKEVGALVTLLAGGEVDVVQHAGEAVARLPRLERCADVAALTAPVPPPSDPTAQAKIAEVESRLAEARSLLFAGRFAPGLEIVHAAATQAAAIGYAPVVGQALRLQATLEESAGEFQETGQTLFEALAAAIAGHDDALQAELWTDLVWLDGVRNLRFAEAHRWERLAAASIARLGGNDELAADLESHLTMTYLGEGKREEALAAGLDALARYERSIGPDHPSVGRLLNRLGNAYFEQKHYPEALSYYRRSLALTERIQGPDHPTAAVRRGNIALVLEDQGDLAGALAEQSRALAIEEKAIGEGHPQIALTHGNLGLLLIKMGRAAEALPHLDTALAIQQAAQPPGHPEIGVARLNRAMGLRALGRPREDEEALALLTRALGPDHEWTVAARNNRAADLRALGQAPR